MSKPPAWHLIAGPTGAGKSTHARGLEADLRAVRFAIDDWMETLFWPDCPQKNDLPWALARVSRCEAQIATVVGALARAGIASILDLGFSQQSQRMAWLDRARAAGIPLILHVLEPPADVRWSRVEARNLGTSDTFTFSVTRAMFNQMETLWQPPTADERALYQSLSEREVPS